MLHAYPSGWYSAHMRFMRFIGYLLGFILTIAVVVGVLMGVPWAVSYLWGTAGLSVLLLSVFFGSILVLMVLAAWELSESI